MFMNQPPAVYPLLSEYANSALISITLIAVITSPAIAAAAVAVTLAASLASNSHLPGYMARVKKLPARVTVIMVCAGAVLALTRPRTPVGTPGAHALAIDEGAVLTRRSGVAREVQLVTAHTNDDADLLLLATRDRVFNCIRYTSRVLALRFRILMFASGTDLSSSQGRFLPCVELLSTS